MKSKFFGFLILLIVILVSVPSVAFAAEGTATSSTTEAETTTSEPETTTEWELVEDYDGYGLLQPVGEYVEDLQKEFSGFSDMANESADDLRSEFSGMSDFLTELFSGLPGILIALIIFVLIFCVVRKIVGR